MEINYGQYGFIGIALYLFVRDVLPFLVKNFWPHKVRQAESRLAAQLKQEEEKVAMARTETEWQHRLDERLAVAIEASNNHLQQLAVGLTTTNERLNTQTNMLSALQTMMVEHDRFTTLAARMQREHESQLLEAKKDDPK